MDVKISFERDEVSKMCEERAQAMLPAPPGYKYSATSQSWGAVTVDLIDASERAA